jgi:U3 small nucleolar ribonucleoprotein component
MQAPEEVFATEAGGAPHAEEELTREERKRRRAQVRRKSSLTINYGWSG